MLLAETGQIQCCVSSNRNPRSKTHNQQVIDHNQLQKKSLVLDKNSDRQLLKKRFSKPKIQLDKLKYLFSSGCLLCGYISLNSCFYYHYCKCVFKLEAIYFYVCKGNKYADYLQNYMHFTESDQNCRRFRLKKCFVLQR